MNSKPPFDSRFAFGHSQICLERTIYHAYTIWLFPLSNIKDTVVPCSLFGIFVALAGPALDLPRQEPLAILVRAPLVLLYIWVNILLFSIHNQRHASSIAEDKINKPWRPLPSGRLSSDDATKLMIATYPITLLISWYQSALMPAVVLMLLSLWYNEYGGSDSNGILRNGLNACGYVCLLAGAMKVATGPVIDSAASISAYKWICTVACLIFTTIHLQDFRDAPGDIQRIRRTFLSVLGDRITRWSVTLGITGWSVLGPWAWKSPLEGYLGPILVGCLLLAHLLGQKGVEADRLTYKIWCVWLITFFPLPWFVWLRALSHVEELLV